MRVITVIDSGLGNFGSVLNMFRRIGADARCTSSPSDVREASKIVLPGVGSFDAGMTALADNGLDDAVRTAVRDHGAMVLGICLGMQLLTEGSEEGVLRGLGLVPGRAVRFDVANTGLRVPHMGWNAVSPLGRSTLFEDVQDELRFYFVHSYYVECADSADVTSKADYGVEFTASFQRDRVLGVQFHPEKSHRFGMDLLRRFSEA